jgi:hypothetical protein
MSTGFSMFSLILFSLFYESLVPLILDLLPPCILVNLCSFSSSLISVLSLPALANKKCCISVCSHTFVGSFCFSSLLTSLNLPDTLITEAIRDLARFMKIVDLVQEWSLARHTLLRRSAHQPREPG